MAKNRLSREEIESRVKQVISKTAGIDEKKLTPKLKLRDDLGIDSFTAIELVYSAEDEFGISIADDEMAKLVTIDDIVKIVQEKLGRNNKNA